jgi:hypothetical protein
MFFAKQSLLSIMFFAITIGVQSQAAAQNQQLDRGMTEWAKKIDEERQKDALKDFERRLEGRPKSSQTIDNVASGIQSGFVVLVIIVIGAGALLAFKVIKEGVSDKKNAKDLLQAFKLKVENVPESTPFAARRKSALLDRINDINTTGRVMDNRKGQFDNISERTIKDFISFHDGQLKKVATDEINYEKKIKILSKDFKKLNEMYNKAIAAKLADDENQFVQILKQIIAQGKPVFGESLLGMDLKANAHDLTERAGYNKNIQDIIDESSRGVGMVNLDYHLQKVFNQWKV